MNWLRDKFQGKDHSICQEIHSIFLIWTIRYIDSVVPAWKRPGAKGATAINNDQNSIA
jgi:hypothetical protein